SPAPATAKFVDQSVPAAPESASKGHAAVERIAFNRSAQRLNLPLYWSADANKNGAIEPDETAFLLFHSASGTAKWVENGAFTSAFEDAYKQIAADAAGSSRTGLLAEEQERRKLVMSELDQGRATLLASDLAGLGSDEKEFVKHVLTAANLIDDL